MEQIDLTKEELQMLDQLMSEDEHFLKDYYREQGIEWYPWMVEPVEASFDLETEVYPPFTEEQLAEFRAEHEQRKQKMQQELKAQWMQKVRQALKAQQEQKAPAEATEAVPEDYPLGRVALEYEKYMKIVDPERYETLTKSGALQTVLREIDKQGDEMMEQMFPQYAKAQGLTEELKSRDFLKWVGLANNIRDQIMEVIRETLIYN